MGGIAFLLAFLYFEFQLESLSLLFFHDICVTLIACISLYRIDSTVFERRIPYVFSVIGTIMAFGSMLVLPMLSLGYPLIVLLIRLDDKNFKRKLLAILQCSLSWLLGYALTMGIKLLISKETLIKSSVSNDCTHYIWYNRNITKGRYSL